MMAKIFDSIIENELDEMIKKLDKSIEIVNIRKHKERHRFMPILDKICLVSDHLTDLITVKAKLKELRVRMLIKSYVGDE